MFADVLTNVQTRSDMLLKLQPSSRQQRKRPMEPAGKQPVWQTELADASIILSAVVPTDGRKQEVPHESDTGSQGLRPSSLAFE